MNVHLDCYILIYTRHMRYHAVFMFFPIADILLTLFLQLLLDLQITSILGLMAGTPPPTPSLGVACLCFDCEHDPAFYSYDILCNEHYVHTTIMDDGMDDKKKYYSAFR